MARARSKGRARRASAVLTALLWGAGSIVAASAPVVAAPRVPAAPIVVTAALVPSPVLATTAQAVPKNDGWVTDLAGLLDSAQEQELETLMESYRQGEEGHEIALLTLDSLDGEPIERLALRTARAWGIGGAEQNNGALIVVAKNDRKLRIEVGNGLEGNLTDLISKRIIRDVIAPEFKRGQFATGIKKGVLATHAAAGGDYGQLPKRREKRGQDPLSLVVFLVFLFFMLSMTSQARRGVGRRVRRRGAPWIFYGGGGGRGGGGGFGGGGFGGGGGGFGGFGGGGGFSGGGSSGGW